MAQNKPGKGKTVLVTGACGYVGTALVPILLNRGYRVRVIDNLMHGINHLQACMDQVEFIQEDIRDMKALKAALEGVDEIYHLAAIVGYPACDSDHHLAREVNVEGTRTLLESMESHQKLVFASTTSCYGQNTNECCSELTPLNPLSVYGITKAEAEKMCLEKGHVGMRLATLFGISMKYRPDLLPHTLIESAMAKGNMELYEATHQRTFLHVKDAAKAFFLAMENYEKIRGQVFNVGADEQNLSKIQLANRIAGILKGSRVETHHEGEDKDKRNYQVAYGKIKKYLGFKPEISIDEGIREIITHIVMREAEKKH